MSKRSVAFIVGAVIMSVTLSVAYVSAQDAPKPEKTFIVGEVIAIADYAMTGRRGEEAAEPGKFQAEKGFPVGILEEETGDIFIAVWRNSAPASHTELANKRLQDLMGMKVAAQGLVYRAKGINVIRMSLVSEY